MKVYAVVEGKTEERLYAAWLGYAYPGVTEVPRIEDVTEDTFYLISNMGFPCILSSIKAAVVDITSNPGQFDLLLIALDTDEATVDARRDDVSRALAGCPISTVVAIQDCCVETWLLGNSKFVASHHVSSSAPLGSEGLVKFRDHYDVRIADPEAMGAPPTFPMSVSDYHYRYLRAAFVERRQSYQKGRPGVAAEAYYAAELVRRHATTGHIASFGRFLNEFRAVGAGGPFGLPATEAAP